MGLGFRGIVLGLRLGGVVRLAGEALSPLLFDNFIGRKRDVGGGVLAGLWLFGLVLRERGRLEGWGLKRH